MKEFPPLFTFRDEFIQVKDFSWEQSRVLMNLDTSKFDMANPNVHRGANDMPQAWAHPRACARAAPTTPPPGIGWTSNTRGRRRPRALADSGRRDAAAEARAEMTAQS
jgi:hypothetical protein